MSPPLSVEIAALLRAGKYTYLCAERPLSNGSYGTFFANAEGTLVRISHTPDHPLRWTRYTDYAVADLYAITCSCLMREGLSRSDATGLAQERLAACGLRIPHPLHRIPLNL